MTLDELLQCCLNQWQRTTELLEKKGDDYSKEDLLSNFKEAGAICGISPELDCLVLISTKIARLGVLLNSKKLPKNESIRDSIDDLRTYTFLLGCILEEKNKFQNTGIFEVNKTKI